MKTVLALLFIALQQPALAQCPENSCAKTREASLGNVNETAAPSLLGTLTLLDPVNGNYQMRASLPATDQSVIPPLNSKLGKTASTTENTVGASNIAPSQSAGANSSGGSSRANSAKEC